MDSLLVGMIAGVIGAAYFMYGKKQQKFAPMLVGVVLCVYPYFIDSVLWLVLIGAALCAVPFFVDF